MPSKEHVAGARVPVAMQPSDAFFWYAEAATPELRPLVAGLFLLDRAPDAVRFRAAIERLTVALPRLRQRVVDPPLGLGLRDLLLCHAAQPTPMPVSALRPRSPDAAAG